MKNYGPTSISALTTKPKTSSGGGGSWGPTKPVPPDRSKITIGSPTQPQISQGMKDFGSTLTVANGSIGYKPPATPKPTAVSSNGSATGTSGTTLPPAGQDYASRLKGVQDGVANLQTVFDSYKKNQESPEKKDETEYLKYLRGIQNPEEAKIAQANYQASLKTLADIQSKKEKVDLDARRRYEKLLDESGGLVSGAQQSASMDRRRSEQELADIALQESAAARTAGVQLSAYEPYYNQMQADNSPLTLEESTALGLPFGTTMAEARKLGVVPGGMGGTEAQSSTVTAYADLIGSGQMNIENVPEEYRGAVAQAVSLAGPQPSISPYLEERMVRNLSSIDDLMGQTSNWTTGMGSLLSAVPGTPAANFKADVNTLAANIAFGELTAMREASKTGGALGAVSEKELMLLESALGSLDRAQSPAQFKESLETIKGSIERWKAAVNQYGTSGGQSGGDESGLYEF